MKTIPILAALCAAIVAFPFNSVAQEAKTYSLKLNRPFKTGQKTHDTLKVVLTKSQKISQAGRTLKEEATELRAELSGISEVKEVTPEGKPRRLSFKVEKFTLTASPAAETQPYKAGTVIEAEGVEGRKKKFTVAGKEVTGPPAEVLKELIHLSGPNKKETDEDAVFGSARPQAPGSEWDVNANGLMETLSDAPFVLAEKDVKGKVKFTGVRDQGGVPCCELKMEITMTPSTFKGLPPGFTLEKSDIKSSGERLVPVNSAGIVPSEKLDQRVDFTGSLPSADGPVSIEFTNRSTKERVSKAVK